MNINLILILAVTTLSFQSPLKKKEDQLSTVPDSIKVHLLSDLCYEYRFISQDSAIEFGNAAIKLATKIKYPKGLAQAYNDLGIIYADLAELNRANELYGKALSIRQEINDSVGVAAIYSKMGILYQKAGKYDSALSNQLKCLRIYESIKSDFGISYTFNNIAILLFNKGDHAGSLDYHSKALKIRRKMKDQVGIATSLGNIGNIYLKINQPEKALLNYKEGFNILNKIDSKDHYASLANNISSTFLLLEELDSAKFYTQKSIIIRKEINDIKGLISSYHNLGIIYQREGNSKEAMTALMKAKELANDHGLMSSSLELSYTLMGYYEELGLVGKALKEAKIHMGLKDSINSINIQKTLAELQTKYETEKKEQQIVLQQLEIDQQQSEIEKNNILIAGLSGGFVLLIIIGFLARNSMLLKREKLIEKEKSNTKQAQVEAALNSQESERKRFARDLHDSFGQMISVLNLNLKSLEKDGSNKEEIFENSSKVLDEMYKELKGICFNLMPETLVKNGVVDAIKEFAYRVNQTDKIQLDVDTFGIDERLEDLQEISIYRITQEWVNNMLKYSNANKATISLTKDESELTLLIEDNGLGFEKNKLINSSGNGWKNMNSRANLINATLELDTVSGRTGNTLIMNTNLQLSNDSTSNLTKREAELIS